MRDWGRPVREWGEDCVRECGRPVKGVGGLCERVLKTFERVSRTCVREWGENFRLEKTVTGTSMRNSISRN